MIIRKLFKFEAGHIVRNCSTERCKWNLHGHSFSVEVFLQADSLDNGGMVMDFGLMKPYISGLIDAFDHSYLLWAKESEEVKASIKRLTRRWVELAVSPSAENLARLFHWFIDRIVKQTAFNNNEKGVTVMKVRVHETATGYAETEPFEDLIFDLAQYGEDIAVFSPEIQKDTNILAILQGVFPSNDLPAFVNPAPELQIC